MKIGYTHFQKRSVEGETASLFVGENKDWIYAMVGVVLGIILLILIGEAIYRNVKCEYHYINT